MKVSKSKGSPESIKMKTRSSPDMAKGALAEWWLAESPGQLASELTSTAAYLKTNQEYRMKQLAVSVRLYSGLSVMNYAGSNVSHMDRTRTLPEDRPTFNLIQSCTDTLVSRLSQNRPEPKFLTDNADYKQRHLAQTLNRFVLGEFYQTKAYDKAVRVLRDAIVMGDGWLKVYEEDNKVAIDRVLATDIYTDDNDALNGTPSTLYQFKLVDRARLIAKNRKRRRDLESAPNAYPDHSADSAKTTADQVMVVEGWKLPVGKKDDENYVPGRHVIAAVGAAKPLVDEEYHKETFPFVNVKYSEPFLGFHGQGLATQLFGTQLTLNRILYTIARSITLVGVPRVFIDQGSKVTKTSQNNEIGVIVTYSGTKPSYEVAPCNAPELYAERDKLIQYGFQQCGVSAMQATAQKPAGLDSGAAIRSYDDISTDRFADLSKRYDNLFVDLAYLVADKAKEIAEREGKYATVYPNKDGTKEIDLPAMKFLNDPFVIQCFTESSLPRTPAGRMASVTEMMQSGMLSVKEGRRLMRVPQDLEQNEQLDNASEERIFQMLDSIVESGAEPQPDPFLDLDLATTLTVQYLNLYLAAKLEESKANKLRNFFTQINDLKMAAQPAPMPGAAPGGPTPLGVPAAPPVSPALPNAPQQ